MFYALQNNHVKKSCTVQTLLPYSISKKRTLSGAGSLLLLFILGRIPRQSKDKRVLMGVHFNFVICVPSFMTKRGGGADI
jgi:hypothetical protein